MGAWDLQRRRLVHAGAGVVDPVRPEVFRPTRWLRYPVVGAVCVWVFVFFALIAFKGAPDRTFLSVGFFITLFSALGVFYNNTCIELTADGVISRGVVGFRLLPWSDIREVEVKPGLFQTTYAVRGRRGLVAFTSIIGGHAKLMQRIVERAGLDRL